MPEEIGLTSMRRVSEGTPTTIGVAHEADGERDESEPYGLRITLEPPELEKVGLESPAVGSTVYLQGNARVVSVSEEGGIELQITDLGVEPTEKPEPKEASEVLYGSNTEKSFAPQQNQTILG